MSQSPWSCHGGAHSATEYAAVTSCPARSLAAALIAQWHAQLTSAPDGAKPG
jgi:hypothetical protein